MIALRGLLKKQEDKWSWTGYWAFGNKIPDDIPLDPATADPSIAKNNKAVRPFLYTFDKAVAASTVEVPSWKPNAENTEEKSIDEGACDGDEVDKKKVEESKLKDEAATVKDKSVSDKRTEAEPGKETNSQTTSLDGGAERKGTVEEGEKKRKEAPVKEEVDKSQAVDETNPSQSADKPVSEPMARKSGNEDDPEASKGSRVSQRITFGTMTNPHSYTEAATQKPDLCPFDGNWTGYFENAPTSKRKQDRKANRVSENMFICFNLTPPPDALSVFPSEENEADPKVEESGKKEKESILPEGSFHVRGMGTNQYGTFELVGSLDAKKGVLEVQRTYVIYPEPKSPSRNRNSSKKATPRSYSTRKRQLKWQRNSTMSDDEDEIVGLKRIVSTKKRARSMSTDVTSTNNKVGTNVQGPSRTQPGENLTPDQSRSSSTTLPPTLSVPVTAHSSKKEASSLPAQPPTKKTKTSSSSSTSKPSSSSITFSAPPASSGVKLPEAGDPNLAKWTAAHFLYYQRHDENQDEADSGGSSNGPGASFVVYEGEMLQGNSLREGRGVCLYNNGTMYEGEWRRNMEHGKGTLMTDDRKRVIYKGDWERGRMHGYGTYYYHTSSTSADTKDQKQEQEQKADSRYEGDFKENMRHGNGKYYLSNGSTYEGEWRENQMSGNGTFVWPDGSIYSGDWKDGKRHGQGSLQTSDGFSYIGAWVQNAMEGRGIATYPGGQQYEGMWVNGRREGRGTILFTNGATYEGRFRDDCMEGQGTLRMTKNVVVARGSTIERNSSLQIKKEVGESQNQTDGEKVSKAADEEEDEQRDEKDDFMIPISFQSDMSHIHQKAGFTIGGD